MLTGPSGGAPHLWRGFCTIRSLPSACRRRVAPLLVQFPPFAGGEVAVRGSEATVRDSEVAVRGGVAPNVQTTSAKNADNGVLWLVVCVVGPCLDSCVARTRTRYCER